MIIKSEDFSEFSTTCGKVRISWMVYFYLSIPFLTLLWHNVSNLTLKNHPTPVRLFHTPNNHPIFPTIKKNHVKTDENGQVPQNAQNRGFLPLKFCQICFVIMKTCGKPCGKLFEKTYILRQKTYIFLQFFAL